VSYAATQVRVKLKELAAAAPDAPVPSPCISVCQIHEATGLCAGCFRTLKEIGAWRSLDDEGKRAIWRQLGDRAKALP
jgi:predicted Fe-S protein YdhL (DUF1289 family)